MGDQTKTIVIVGGGPAGASLLYSMRQTFKKSRTSLKPRYVVIDPREYWEAAWASIRAMFDEKTREGMCVNLKDFVVEDTQVIRGKVVELKENEVVVSGSEDGDGDRREIKFDCCVLATGSSYRGTVGVFKAAGEGVGVRKVRLKGLKEMGEKIKEAESVCVAGGGAVGVEVAGEILDWYPGKKVLVVHKGTRLLDGFQSVKASRLIQEKLEKMGCVVKLNEEIVEETGGSLKGVKSGEVYTADLVFKCMGVTPNSGFMVGKMAEKVDKWGFIKVDEHFRVEGMKKVFALGDCCNASRKKLCAEIGFQYKTAAKCVVQTLIAEEKKEEPRLNKYREGPNVVCTVLGRTSGVAITPLGATTMILPYIKNKSLFVNLQKGRSGIPY